VEIAYGHDKRTDVSLPVPHVRTTEMQLWNQQANLDIRTAAVRRFLAFTPGGPAVLSPDKVGNHTFDIPVLS
jgi:hypothetical protein